MRKKLWIAVILLAAGLVSQWLTVNAFSDNFREKAEKYIAEMAEVDPFWKWENPKIVWQTPFYDSDDNKPSYIEYKVSCNRDTNCWYVLVNLDGSDVDIPESSSVWKAPSEQMDKTGNWKNYNFWVFEKFSYDENTWDIWYINPGNEALEEQAKQSVFSKNTMSSVKTNPLKEKFGKLKKEAKENKEENIQKQLLNKSVISNDTMLSSSLSPMKNGHDFWLLNDHINEWDCYWVTPCYNQHMRSYWDQTWYSWCVPTAFSILYWFYDRNWKDDLISWKTPIVSNSVINNLQVTLWEIMWTYRNNKWEWATSNNRIINWFNYKNNIYSRSYQELSYDLRTIKKEIDDNRPVILRYTCSNGQCGHAIVVHWYNKNDLVVNFWWGPNSSHKIISTNGKSFTWYRSWEINKIFTMRFNNSWWW